MGKGNDLPCVPGDRHIDMLQKVRDKPSQTAHFLILMLLLVRLCI